MAFMVVPANMPHEHAYKTGRYVFSSLSQHAASNLQKVRASALREQLSTQFDWRFADRASHLPHSG
jgi:hypothetical protein